MEEYSLPAEPERNTVFLQKDQLGSLLAAELVEAALTAQNAFGENKIIDAHNALATTAQLMHGLIFSIL